MRRRAQFLALTLLVTVFAACGGGDDDDGGGGGPTTPPALPQVAGAWVGEWTSGGVVFQPTLNLTQSGSTINGTFTLFDNAIMVRGSVSTALQMSWSSVPGSSGCGALSGNGTIDALAATRVTGNLVLDTTGCANPATFVGPVVWRRAGSSFSAATPAGSLGKIADEVRRSQ